MEVLVILVVLIFAFIFIGGSLKAKARMNFADTQRSNANALKGTPSAPPSWRFDEARGDAIFESILKLCDAKGISRDFVLVLMVDPDIGARVFGIAGMMEREGHGIVAQQAAIFEFIQTLWNEMDPVVRDKTVKDAMKLINEAN